MTSLKSKPISRASDNRQLHLPEFNFIDLFAGIGGMRLAFEEAGGQCVFSSEWDRFSQETYHANFEDNPAGDITEISASSIPKHDVLVAGFPCQPFSIAGVSKHNALGNKHGFDHPTQGTLFFEIVRILKARKPRAFLLENVKNLKSHDGGRTFEVIMDTLKDDLGYDPHETVIDSRGVLPQHRERTYIVGFRKKTKFEFPNVSLNGTRPTLKSMLELEPHPKYTLSAKLWNYLQEYALKHRRKGNGFGFGLVDPNKLDVTTRTLSARYYKDGSEILIDTGGERPRRLTPGECARLMGFPPDFQIPVSDTQAYKQFGNSVAVPVVKEIASAIAQKLR